MLLSLPLILVFDPFELTISPMFYAYEQIISLNLILLNLLLIIVD